MQCPVPVTGAGQRAAPRRAAPVTAAKSKGGRPLTFDKQQAVDVAMRLFWEHGYEGVSINDLTAAMGIAPPSLYAAFGSKADLYRASLDRYMSTTIDIDLSVFDRAASLRDAVQAILEMSVRVVTGQEAGRGCMITTGMLVCNSEHEDLAVELAEMRSAFREEMTRKIARWTTKAKARALARSLTAVMQGMSVQARDGATAAQLKVMIAPMLNVVDDAD